MKAILSLIVLCVWIGLPSIVLASSPNFLLITVDNLDYGDLPCYRKETSIKTPNLDRLAAEGARLTNFYTASSTCAISRGITVWV